jgi:crotonyl-CoA carboxylase/reductase
VGSDVTRVKVGDRVVLCPAHIDPYADDIVTGGMDQSISKSLLAWGYETNFGSFAQYTVVDDYQCYAKPPRLTWAEASSYMLCGGTAYRQLMGWAPNTVQPGDPVLIWGGAGALGSMAIQLTKHAGGIPVAVVSDADKAEHCLRLGAKGVIQRNHFTHWGRLPDLNDVAAYKTWLGEVRKFGQAFWEALGEKRSPRIVFEHSGAATIPTSLYLCDNGGMVVSCGATSGYNGDVDMRFLWMRQKRLQGSHGANMRQYDALNTLVASGALNPCLTQVAPLPDAARLHEVLRSNRSVGNLALLVGANDAHSGSE